MDVKKYRLYLVIITLVVGLAGAIIYYYYADKEKTYRDGILVQNEYVMEEMIG